ncbi:MAG: type IV pilus secretin PilQ family protein [Legionellales bacterium]|nr:type IV pilus secretin PilQ family protein [Legionellales bacterium]
MIKLCCLCSIFLLGIAQAAALINTEVEAKANSNVRLIFDFNAKVAEPASFILQGKNPSIVMDFPAATNSLKNSNVTVAKGAVDDFSIVQADGRTRVVVALNKLLSKSDYQIKRLSDRKIALTINGILPEETKSSIRYRGKIPPVVQPFALNGIDFRRAENGGGKIVIDASNAGVNLNVEDQAGRIILTFLKTSIPHRLQRRLDVTDFNTPVQDISLNPLGSDARITIENKGLYQHLVYQLGKQFIITVTPLTPEQKQKMQEKNRNYTGERISLNFQNIPVRSVLQLLAEFTGLNVVVSDTVNGNITLRLKDVPWDQALDIILKTQGLAERRMGNVILIAPAEELAARERQELETNQQVADLAPLHGELIQINYAKADEIAKLLQSEGASILSDRGTVSVDERTNTLWVQDTSAKLSEVRDFIRRLDVPVRQVMIKARVVNVESTFSRDIGVQFGITRRPVTGTLAGSNAMQQTGDDAVGTQEVPISQRLNLNLPSAGVGTPGGAASIGVALARLGSNTLLDLELSALESEGGGEIISSPTLITSNQKDATIEQGVEIPYQQASSSGATVVAFKKAVLSLNVTPQITPDNRIILTLQVNQDTPGEEVLGVPAVNTREVQTQVLVNNGETIVLGGIYEQTTRNQVSRVPFLGDLPVVGRLFRHTTKQDDRRELLIFITPKIIKQSLTYLH